ncbi:MAG: hypothetical protein K2X94_02910 [Amoebophilaceae bacterium]|nr:hypothetical protein [Amoebophilaceae bacterium]
MLYWNTSKKQNIYNLISWLSLFILTLIVGGCPSSCPKISSPPTNEEEVTSDHYDDDNMDNDGSNNSDANRIDNCLKERHQPKIDLLNYLLYLWLKGEGCLPMAKDTLFNEFKNLESEFPPVDDPEMFKKLVDHILGKQEAQNEYDYKKFWIKLLERLEKKAEEA